MRINELLYLFDGQKILAMEFIEDLRKNSILEYDGTEKDVYYREGRSDELENIIDGLKFY